MLFFMATLTPSTRGEVNKTLVLNPGETCEYLTNEETIALLDLGTLSFKKINL